MENDFCELENVVTLDANLNILYLSPPFTNLMRYGPWEMAARPASRIFDNKGLV